MPRIRPQVAILIVLALFLAGRGHSEFVEFRRAYRVYSDLKAGIDTGFFERLAATKNAGLSDFALKAKISLQTIKRPVVFTDRTLSPILSRSHRTADWEFPPSPGQAPSIRFAASGAELSESDELWVEYTERSTRVPCPVYVSMDFDTKTPGKEGDREFAAITGRDVLRTISEIDPAAAVWEKKNKGYPISRILRRKPDGKWRYTYVDGKTVLQQRLHAPLSGLETFDLIFAHGTQVEGLIVRLSGGDDYAPGKTIDLTAKREAFEDSDGRLIWRVHVPGLIGASFPGREKVFLQELMVHLKGDISIQSGSMPFLGLTFQARVEGAGLPIYEEPVAASGGGKGRPKILPYKVERISSTVKRMTVYLQALGSSERVILKQGVIAIPASAVEAGAGVKIQRVRLVTLYHKPFPAFVFDGGSFNYRWGGPFSLNTSPEHLIEWPVLSAYLPFAVLAPIPDAAVGAYAFSPAAGGGRYGLGARRERNSHSFAERGVSFSSELPLERLSDGNAILLKGAGRTLDVEIPVSVRLSGSEKFFLGVMGSAPEVHKIELAGLFDSGPELNLSIDANSPVSLNRSGALKAIRLKINFPTPQFRIRLTEAVIFTPKLVRLEEAFSFHLPEQVYEKPLPTNFSAPAGISSIQKSGTLNGEISPRPSGDVSARQAHAVLRWTTPLAAPIAWPKRLHFSYKVPPNSSRCWLNLTLNWQKRSINRDICVEGASGEIDMPISTFLDGYSGETGSLISAAWRADLNVPAGGTEGKFNFDAAFEGVDLRSASEELGLWPVLHFGGRALGFLRKGTLARDIMSGRVWVTLSQMALGGGLWNSETVQPVGSPWFQLHSVYVVPRNDLSEEIWGNLTEELAPGETSKLPVIVTLLGFVVLGVAAYKLNMKWGYLCMCLMDRIGHLVSRIQALVWAYAPDKMKASLFLGDKERGSILFWFVAAFGLYAIGLLKNMLELLGRLPRGEGENYFYTFGGVAAALLMSSALRAMAPVFRKRWGKLSQYVFGGQGSLYFFCSSVAFILSLVLLMVGVVPVAEQLAAIAFYHLCIGAAKELFCVFCSGS